MKRSGKAWERRQKRLRYSRELMERAFAKRAEKIPVNQYLFGDPRIKTLMRRLDRNLRASRPRRVRHRKTR